MKVYRSGTQLSTLFIRSRFLYSERYVIESDRNYERGKPLLTYPDAGDDNASLSGSFWTPVDFYNGLSDLPGIDKLFFVWDKSHHCLRHSWLYGAPTYAADDISPLVLLFDGARRCAGHVDWFAISWRSRCVRVSSCGYFCGDRVHLHYQTY